MAAAQTTSDRTRIHPRSKPQQAALTIHSLRGRRLGPAVIVLGVLCVATLLVTSSTLLSYANDAVGGPEALRLHVQLTYRVLEQPASGDSGTDKTDGPLARGEHETNNGENAAQPGRKESPPKATKTTAISELPRVPYTEPPVPASTTAAEPNGSDPAATELTAGMTRLRRENSGETESEQDATALTNQPTTTIPGLRTHHDRFDASVSRQRGVIIALHDGIVPLGLSLIKDLRCLGNTELIQVYHCFPDELSPESRELLLRNETRVEIVDVCTYYVEKQLLTMELATAFRNWWIKPLALHHTNVRESIVLDADVIALQDPAVLRSLPGYRRTGTTFFYDRVQPWTMYFNTNFGGQASAQLLRHWVETFDYASLNLTGPAPSQHLLDSLAFSRLTCHEMDSSMLAIDKSRAGKAMDVLWRLITQTRFEFEFSWGDKEAFWLAYEFAHVDYFFSPWGVSVVSSSPSRDMEDHPDTLCGSLAHFLPVHDETPELLYVNGKALIEPYPAGVQASREANENQLFNVRPTHVTPRQVRKEKAYSETRFFDECLVGMGSTPLSSMFHWHLLRRRTFYLGILTGVVSPWHQCAMF